jgi:hypothetical protein
LYDTGTIFAKANGCWQFKTLNNDSARIADLVLALAGCNDCGNLFLAAWITNTSNQAEPLTTLSMFYLVKRGVAPQLAESAGGTTDAPEHISDPLVGWVCAGQTATPASASDVDMLDLQPGQGAWFTFEPLCRYSSEQGGDYALTYATAFGANSLPPLATLVTTFVASSN